MLVSRKKRKDRQKKIKIAIFSAFFILASGAFLGYWIWANILSKAHYISPLASGSLSYNSIKNEKEIMMVEDLLKEKQIEFVSIDSSTPTTYTIHLKDDAIAIISQEKDLNVQISSLQFIMHKLKMEGRRFSRLDLSFDKPVIVFR